MRAVHAASRRSHLLALALLVCSGTACADWAPVGGTSKTEDYIDLATVQVTGNLRRVWTLHNLLQPDSDGDRSYRSLLEYDCKNAIYRSLQGLFHSQPMAAGRMTGRTDAASPWRAVEAGSMSAAVMRLVCARTSTVP